MTTTPPPEKTAPSSRYTGPRFSTILADPPWDVQQKGARGAERKYDLLTLDQIKAMPIEQIATEDAHLWLWVTNATLRDGYDVAEAWGFTVRSPLTWVKWPRIGLGNYLRNNTEHLLFATRGKAPVKYRSQPTWFTAPTTDHSHKPEAQFSTIELVSGAGPKLELFARRRPPQTPDSPWSAWGNEIDSDISIPDYPVPSDFDDQTERS
ncbi:MT-A70 family methyltransferase [Microbacterium sp. HA-8]|uniref:MT-A70 family methyltransferase n=1 Tax=Microbacterium sp. HA-8 TaxID=3234200 RepID=UPI00055E5628